MHLERGIMLIVKTIDFKYSSFDSIILLAISMEDYFT